MTTNASNFYFIDYGSSQIQRTVLTNQEVEWFLKYLRDYESMWFVKKKKELLDDDECI